MTHQNKALSYIISINNLLIYIYDLTFPIRTTIYMFFSLYDDDNNKSNYYTSI